MIKEHFQQYWVLFFEKVQISKYFKAEKEYLSQIYTLVIPLFIESTLQTLLSTVDRYFACSLDDSAFAAIGVTELVLNLYLAFFMAINVGLSVVIGKNIGKKDIKQASDVAIQGIILSTLLGIAVGLVSLLFGKQLLLFTGCTEEILIYAVPYFSAVAVPSVLLSLSLTLSACLRATKDTKSPMLLISCCNILNILLNILFLKLGLGIFGIGLATTISRLFLTMGLFITLLRKNHVIHFEFKTFRLNKSFLNEIITIGLPVVVEKLAMRCGQLAYTAMILSLGTDAYVAHTLTATIENYIYIPIFSFATTTSILVSISFGEENPEKAAHYVSLVSKINASILAIFSILFILCGKSFLGIFTDSQQTISNTYPLLIILACSVPFIGITHIYTSALQGSGNTRAPMYATLFGIWVIRLGMGFLFTKVFRWGITGFWIVLALDSAIRSVFLNKIYRNEFKTQNRKPILSIH